MPGVEVLHSPWGGPGPPLASLATGFQPRPTFRSPSDMTLVWLSLFMLLLREIAHYSPPPPLLGVLNTEDLSRPVWETVSVLVSLLRPQVCVLFPPSNHMGSRRYRGLTLSPRVPHFCAHSCQHPRPHAWGLSLATQQAASARGLILPGSRPRLMTAGSWWINTPAPSPRGRTFWSDCSVQPLRGPQLD